MQLHISLRRLQRRKSKLRVESVRIERRQGPAPQILQRWMLHNALHQPFAQSAPTMRLEHKDVANIRVGSEIADHARKPDLGTRRIVHSKAQRVSNRALDHFPRNALGPIAIRQKAVDHVQVKPRTIGTDEEIAAPMFNHGFRLNLPSAHHPHILQLDP